MACSNLDERPQDGADDERWLFFANREPQDAAFLHELQALAEGTSAFHLVTTMTALRDSVLPWVTETGHIDMAMIH